MKKLNAIIMAMVVGYCTLTQAELITLTISGTGSGSLNKVPYTDKMFEWDITYDTTDYRFMIHTDNQLLFSNPTSVFTLEGETSAINVTAEYGVLVYAKSTPVFVIIPIRMYDDSVSSNILLLQGTEAWDGVSDFTASTIDSVGWAFSNIETDQGALTVYSGTISSIVAAVPEPASALLIGCGGAFVALIRRSVGRRI